MVSRYEPLGALPPEHRDHLLAIGSHWGEDISGHRRYVIDCYTPVLRRARHCRHVERDVSYGPHPRHRMDIFIPEQADPGDESCREFKAHGKRDAVIFVHGGAFVRGEKSVNGEVYDNVCHWFANQGVVAVNLEYRLAHDAPYPGGAMDVADALRHVRAESGRLGFDPRRLFLMGHSAGGSHAAACLYDPMLSEHVDPDCIAGLVLISARLFADVLPGNPNAAPVRAYFGDDETRYAQQSPLTHIARSPVPLMIAVAEFENPYLDLYGAQAFAAACTHHGVAPRFIQMRGHNHTSIVAHFNSGEQYLGEEILTFFDAACRG